MGSVDIPPFMRDKMKEDVEKKKSSEIPPFMQTQEEVKKKETPSSAASLIGGALGISKAPSDSQNEIIVDEEFETKAKEANRPYEYFQNKLVGKAVYRQGEKGGGDAIIPIGAKDKFSAEEITNFEQGDIIEYPKNHPKSKTGYKQLQVRDGQWVWQDIVKPAQQYKVEEEVIKKGVRPSISPKDAKVKLQEQIVADRDIPMAVYLDMSESDRLNQRLASNPDLFKAVQEELRLNPDMVRTGEGRFNVFNNAIVKKYGLDEDPLQMEKFKHINVQELENKFNEAKAGKPDMAYFQQPDVKEFLSIVNTQNEGLKELGSTLEYFPKYRDRVLEAEKRYASKSDKISFLRSLAGGVSDTLAGLIYSGHKLNPLSLTNPAINLKADKAYDDYRLWSASKFTTPKDTGTDVVNFANQALRSVPQLAGIILSKNPQLGVAGFIGMPSFSESYNESLRKGLSQEQSYVKGIADASIQVLSEAVIPEKRLVAGFKPSKKLGELAVREFGSETFNKTLSKELKDYWKDQPGEFIKNIAGQYLEEQIADKASKLNNIVTNAITGSQFEVESALEDEKNILGSVALLTLGIKALGVRGGTNPKAKSYRDYIIKNAAIDPEWGQVAIETLKADPEIDQEYVAEIENDLQNIEQTSQEPLDTKLAAEEINSLAMREPEAIVKEATTYTEDISDPVQAELFKENPEQGLREAAQQLHGTTGEAETANKFYGKRIADLALELYPTKESLSPPSGIKEQGTEEIISETQPTEKPPQGIVEGKEDRISGIEETFNVNKDIATQLHDIANTSKDFSEFKEKAKSILGKSGLKFSEEAFSKQEMEDMWQQFKQRIEKRALSGEKTPTGVNEIKTELKKGVSDGKISEEAAQLAEDLLDANPNLFEKLSFTISKADMGSTGGVYNPFLQFANIFDAKSDPLTIAHEFLHHTERFLPDKYRNGIIREWRREISKQTKDFEKKLKTEKSQEKKELIKKAIEYLNLSSIRQGVKHEAGTMPDIIERQRELFQEVGDQAGYKYLTPSEWWAENASRIFRERKGQSTQRLLDDIMGDRSWVDKVKEFYTQLIEALKKAFGNKPRFYEVERALDKILKGEKLTEREGIQEISRSEKSDFEAKLKSIWDEIQKSKVEGKEEEIRNLYIDEFNIVEDSKFMWRVKSELSSADRKKAVEDIKAGKNTAAARKLEQEIQETIDRGTVIINRGRGNQAETVEIPINEWFGFNTEEQNKIIESLDKFDEETVKIIEEEGITLQNLDKLKHLFDGFPYEQSDFQRVKTYLEREGKSSTNVSKTSTTSEQESPQKEVTPTEISSEITDEQPPVEPPKPPDAEDIVEGSEELPERRFTKQMLRSDELSDESKAEIAKTLNYVRQTNEMSVKEAGDIINKVGVAEAQGLVMNDSDLKPAVRVTLAQMVIKKYNELSKVAAEEGSDAHRDYYLDKTIQTANFVTEKLATEAGQQIQAFSMWSRLSPEGQLRAANQDMARQGKEKMRRREKDINTIGDKFKKANEETVEEVVKEIKSKRPIQKEREEKISKSKEKIKKAKEKRAEIIKKYKGEKGKNLFSSPLGLTPEGIEFVGEVAKTYIQEGVANIEILVQKVIQHLEDVSGKNVNDDIRKQVQELSDKAYNKADMSLLGKAFKEKEIKISEIVKEHYTVVEKTRKNLAQKFMEEADMSQSNAQELAKSVEDAFDRIATRKKRNILYHEKARFDKINNTLQGAKKPDKKTVADDIIKYSNLGAFENKDFAEMIASKFGLGEISKEQAAKLQELAEKIQKAPEGTPKRDATEDLLAYRAKIRGNDLMETVQGVWYANVLSGYKTQEKNIVSTFFQSMGELTTEMAKDPKAIPYLLGGYIKGVTRRGFIEALHTLKTGRSPIHIKKIETPQALERKKFKGGSINPANWLKYVMRVMIASDVVSFQGLKEARAYQLARRDASRMGINTWSKKGWDKVNEILLHTRERWLIAQDQAESEGLKEGTTEWRRRIYELMEEGRPVKMTEDAYGFAAKGTFNHESEGSLGALTNAVAYGLDVVSVGGFKPLRIIVPFTRIITNVVNNTLDYTPVGFIRAARGVRGFKSFDISPVTKSAYKELSKEERHRLIAKASIGITLSIILQALHDSGIIEITGGGPDDEKKKRQLRESGWQEYSIKIGNRYYSYKYTPMVFMTGFLGNMNDARKYNSDDEETFLNRVQFAATRIGGQVADMTWINSASTFLGALSETNPDQQVRKLNNAFAGMTRGFIPFSGMANQSSELMQNIFNIPQKQVNNAWQALIQNIPIARNSLNDKINALGDPIVRDPDVIISEETKDPVWKFLLDKQGWVATVNRGTLLVFDEDTKLDRPVTIDEYYEFSKLRGEIIKKDIEKIIKNGYPVLRDGKVETVTSNELTSKELNEILSKKEREATIETKKILFGEKKPDKRHERLKQRLRDKRESFDKNKH